MKLKFLFFWIYFLNIYVSVTLTLNASWMQSYCIERSSIDLWLLLSLIWETLSPWMHCWILFCAHWMFVSCVFFGDCQNLSTNLAPELSYHCISSISSYCALSLSDVSVMLKQLLLCYTCSHLLILKFNVFSLIGTGI